MKAHAPVAYDLADLHAIRACIAGTATEDQQRRAMGWIINGPCALYDMSYRDEAEGGDRGTAFHEGRRFVGNTIVKMTRQETLMAAQKAAESKRKPSSERQKSDE